MNEKDSSTRVFSDEELAEIGTRTSDLVHEAIEQGDRQKAHELLDRLVRESRTLHDAYLRWIAAMQSFIYREYGDEAFYRSQHESYTKAVAPQSVGVTPPADFREAATRNLLQLHLHATPLDIEEDEEKVSARMVTCGSGARLLNDGFYDDATNTLIRDAQPMTFGRTDFPPYCTHCAMAQAEQVEGGLALVRTIEPADDLRTGTCRFNLYKPGHGPSPAHVDSLRYKDGQPVRVKPRKA